MAFDTFHLLYVNSTDRVEFHPNPSWVEEVIVNDDVYVSQGGHLFTHRIDGKHIRYAFPITFVTSSFKDELTRAWREESQVYIIFNSDTSSQESLKCDITNSTEPFNSRTRQQYDKYSGNLYLTAQMADTANGRNSFLDLAFRLDDPNRGLLDQGVVLKTRVLLS